MKKHQTIETIGFIEKTEHLITMHQNIIENTLVLKTQNPYPGINKTLSGISTKPESYFIILKQRYNPESINRINCILYRHWNLLRYPSYAEITIGNTTFSSIRFKELKSVLHLIPLQQYLLKLNIEPADFKKVNTHCKIKTFKTFRLIEFGEGLYRDLQDKSKFYIRIHTLLNQKKLELIMNKIKSTISSGPFDAAFGVIYRFTGPENVIRIYDNYYSPSRANLIRQMFIDEINNPLPFTQNTQLFVAGKH